MIHIRKVPGATPRRRPASGPISEVSVISNPCWSVLHRLFFRLRPGTRPGRDGTSQVSLGCFRAKRLPITSSTSLLSAIYCSRRIFSLFHVFVRGASVACGLEYLNHLLADRLLCDQKNDRWQTE